MRMQGWRKGGEDALTREEFIEMIDTGGDIMFDCDGRSYTILYWADGGPDIAEQVTEDNTGASPTGRFRRMLTKSTDCQSVEKARKPRKVCRQ